MTAIRPKVWATATNMGLNHVKWGPYRGFCGVDLISPYGQMRNGWDNSKLRCGICEQLYKEYRADIDAGGGGYGLPPLPA